jgi:thiol-disulfide isomerase/thioredoxin
MVATPSTMLQLGTRLPDFILPDAVSGRTMNQDELAGDRATLVMFICNHCPYVQHIIGELDRLAEEYLARGVSVVAISSNDIVAYPEDRPELMKALAADHGWKFPYLFDAAQQVAMLFQAACTPDFFLFDRQRALVYRGQFDDSRPKSNTPVTGRDLRAALDAVLDGKPVPENQRPSLGCNIKWTSGNEPAYLG